MIFQIYLPCMLFVGMSWVSFLIRPDVVPGRMALLVTLFLVLVNIFNTVRYIACKNINIFWLLHNTRKTPKSYSSLMIYTKNGKHYWL